MRRDRIRVKGEGKGREREMEVSASMTARDNLIIILMWDVMNNSQHTDKNTHTHTHGHRVKGQYISIHYVEQHITMRASMSATEVNALHRAVGKLASIPVRERQSLQHLFLEIHDDTQRRSVSAGRSRQS